MMPRIYLFFLLGALPLSAQTAVGDTSKVNPGATVTMTPAAPTGGAIMQPGVTAPPPGAPEVLPMRPGLAPVLPKLIEFTVSPGTVREGFAYEDRLKTVVKLSAPAVRLTVFHIVSSDPYMVLPTNITLVKGHDTGYGGIKINWQRIKRDVHIKFEAHTEENPEIVLEGRIYVRTKPGGVETPRWSP